MTGDLFMKSLNGWLDRTQAELDSLARVSCQDVAEAVIDNTRIDTGFLVGNWQPSLDAPDLSVDDVGKGNGYAQSKLGITVANIKAGDVFYYVNNASYARRREHGFVGADSLGRVYNEPGDHMVANAISKWDVIVQRAAVKIGLAA